MILVLHYTDDSADTEWFPAIPDDLNALTDTEVGRMLACAISYLSEEYHCAGWMMGIEDIAWGWSGGETTTPTGAPPLDHEADGLRRLRERLRGGWVAWDDDTGGACLLSAEEWARAYEPTSQTSAGPFVNGLNRG